jgi:hypothetical protein
MQVTPGSSTAIPTWSWAKLSVEVTWPRFASSRPLRSVEIVDVRYKTVGPVVSGDIEVAVIELLAPLIRLDTMPTEADLAKNGAMSTLPPEHMAEPFVTKCYRDDYEQPTGHMERVVRHPVVNQRKVVFGVPLFFQDMDTTRMFGDWKLESQVVLMVVKTDKSGQFRRLGTAKIALKEATLPLQLGIHSMTQLKTAENWHQQRLFDWLDNLDSEGITSV